MNVEMEAEKKVPKTLHHLMRVRIRRSLFLRLREIAKEESNGSGDYTSVSDIVRAALLTWIQTHESTNRLKAAVDHPIEVVVLS